MGPHQNGPSSEGSIHFHLSNVSRGTCWITERYSRLAASRDHCCAGTSNSRGCRASNLITRFWPVPALLVGPFRGLGSDHQVTRRDWFEHSMGSRTWTDRVGRSPWPSRHTHHRKPRLTSPDRRILRVLRSSSSREAGAQETRSSKVPREVSSSLIE